MANGIGGGNATMGAATTSGGGGYRRKGRGSMYKDAGVMGGKIKSTLASNPMMTSPAGFNPSGAMAGHFQPAAFQPEAEPNNATTEQATTTSTAPAPSSQPPPQEHQQQHQQPPAGPQFFDPNQFGAPRSMAPPPMPTS